MIETFFLFLDCILKVISSFAPSDQYQNAHNQKLAYDKNVYSFGTFEDYENGRDLSRHFAWGDFTLQVLALTL